MRRGEIWTLRDKQYATKARPVVIIQSDNHNSFDSVILCLFTSFDSSNVPTRVYIPASLENGLMQNSYVMTDKIVTVNKDLLTNKIGHLSNDDMKQISQKLKLILDL